jgi:uncharacterized protein (DUF433 family)
MQLEDYFDFSEPEAIRIQGHRIWIEDVLYDYIHHGLTVEQLADRFPTLSFDKILATLLYYLRNKAAMDRYLDEWLEWGNAMRKEQAERGVRPQPHIQRTGSEQTARAER